MPQDQRLRTGRVDKLVWKMPANQKGLRIVRKVFEALDNKSPVFPKEKEIHEQMAARRSAGGFAEIA